MNHSLSPFDTVIVLRKEIKEKRQWKNEDTKNVWKEENLKIIMARMKGWQLDTFKESYEHKKIKEYLYLKKIY